MAIPAKLSAFEMGGALSAAVIGHSGRIKGCPFLVRPSWAEPPMLADMTGGANDSPRLQFSVEASVFLVPCFTTRRIRNDAGRLFGKRCMAGQALERLFGVVSLQIDDLSPRSGAHRLAVQTFLPIRILLRVAAAACFWP